MWISWRDPGDRCGGALVAILGSHIFLSFLDAIPNIGPIPFVHEIRRRHGCLSTLHPYSLEALPLSFEGVVIHSSGSKSSLVTHMLLVKPILTPILT